MTMDAPLAAAVRPVRVVAPDNLMPVLLTMLEAEPQSRAAAANGLLTFSEATAEDCSDADILIAPTPDGAIAWALAREPMWRFAVPLASRLLSRMARVAETGQALVVAEDLITRDPTAARQLVMERISARTGFLQPPDGAPFGKTAAAISLAAPLEIFRRLPVPGGARAHWAPGLFWHEQGDCPSSINIAGRARILFYGPYVVLPPGTWRATLHLDFSEMTAPYDYLVEFGTLDRFSRRQLRPQQSGPQQVSLAHTVTEALPLEIRFSLLRAGFVGEIGFGGCEITKLD